jgi:uncharacterized metal-binding protein
MPTGETHLKIWKVGTMVAIPTSIYLAITKQPLIGIGFGIGYLTGLFIDPDADEMGATSGEGRMVKIPILGWIMYGISSVYGAIFRRHHRSFLTHFPFVSTAIRLLFFFFWIPILYYFNLLHWQPWHLTFYLWFWIGLSCADALHWMADMIVSDVKKINREPKWNKEDNKLRS